MEMAKFLQEAMGELSLDLKKSNAINADEFTEFMQKVFLSSLFCIIYFYNITILYIY